MTTDFSLISYREVPPRCRHAMLKGKGKNHNTYIAPQAATADAAALLCHRQSERTAYRP